METATAYDEERSHYRAFVREMYRRLESHLDLMTSRVDQWVDHKTFSH